MKKPIIGTTRPLAPAPVGDAYQEQLLFNYDGLGRQANPMIRAAYVAPQVLGAGWPPRSSGAEWQRGFECVTLLCQGRLESAAGDAPGVPLAAGDVLWRGVGQGAWHEHRVAGAAEGDTLELLTLWINLPAAYKGVAPHQQLIGAAELPALALPDGAGSLRVIAGQWQQTLGPAETVTPLQLWDLSLAANRAVTLPLVSGWHALLLLLQGDLRVSHWPQRIEAPSLVVCGTVGNEVELESAQGARLVLLSAEPLDEPIAGLGACVMNQPQQLTAVAPAGAPSG
jgi:redox-sensitive bicupin YhaK (pirin superfamily)